MNANVKFVDRTKKFLTSRHCAMCNRNSFPTIQTCMRMRSAYYIVHYTMVVDVSEYVCWLHVMATALHL